MNTKLGGCESSLSALTAVQQPVATVAAATRVSRIGAAVIRTKTLQRKVRSSNNHIALALTPDNHIALALNFIYAHSGLSAAENGVV